MPSPRALDEELEVRIRELTASVPATGPGGVIAVARAGEVVATVPFGLASIEHAVPNTAETVFYIASTSKQFVAAAVALLESDGVMGADDPVGAWLPEVAHLGDIHVHHLVHHTSGIRDKYAIAALGHMPEETYSTDVGTLAMLRRQRTLNFPPGERFEYSNSGYFLLARLVERASGMPFVDFTEQRLFAPVGMTATRFRSDTSEVIPHRASGYGLDASSGLPRLEEYTWSSLGPGGVISTAASLARWGLVWQGASLPGLAERLRVVRPFNDGTTGDYGYGVMLGEHGGRPLIRHSGGVQGFSAEMIQLPDEQLTVVALCNSGAVPAPVLAERTLALVVPASASAAPAVESVPCADDLVGVYLAPEEASVARVVVDESGPVLEISSLRAPLARTETGWELPNGMRLGLDGAALVVHAATVPLRFEAASLGERAFTDVEGDYRSDELSTVVSVSSGEGGLTAAWPGEEPLSLEHLGGDLYRVPLSWPGMKATVRFLGEGSRASSMRLGVDRAVGTILTRT